MTALLAVIISGSATCAIAPVWAADASPSYTVSANSANMVANHNQEFVDPQIHVTVKGFTPDSSYVPADDGVPGRRSGGSR